MTVFITPTLKIDGKEVVFYGRYPELSIGESAEDAVTFVCRFESLPRCQNCGKVMDETVCPFCGFVQK